MERAVSGAHAFESIKTEVGAFNDGLWVESGIQVSS